MFKYESGVHRVQRVPENRKVRQESTPSTITVAGFAYTRRKRLRHSRLKDLNIEATTSSGHGGQSVNTTL